MMVSSSPGGSAVSLHSSSAPVRSRPHLPSPASATHFPSSARSSTRAMSQQEQQQADCADDATAAAARQEARRIVARRRQLEPLYYSSYLHVNELLSLQRPKSEEAGTPAHDEMLFIITHQAYELWFRQILHELNSVRAMFSGGAVAERDMGVAVSRLERVREIQTLMLQQINVLETMSALDFLSFRDFLYPASGFQSVQFRLIENCLGLRSESRLSYGGRTGYCSVLNETEAAAVAASEQSPSLFQLTEAWLERTPFLECAATEAGGGGGGGGCGSGGGGEGFSFWEHYRSAVQAMLDADEVFLRANSAVTPATLASHARDLASQRAHFEALFDPAAYAAGQARGECRLSHRATQAALMITLFQREPGLHLPHRFLCGLMAIDEQLCAWRARHAQMVHRMVGAKLGTGGSSGHSYLKATVDKHRIFTDLFNLSTFLIPEAMLPPLPKGVVERLAFNFSSSSSSSSSAAAAPASSASASAAAASSSSAALRAAAAAAAAPPAPAGVCPYGHS